MKEQELFKSLKDEVNNGVLPFDESDWQQLRKRLDKKEERATVPFVRIKRSYFSIMGVAAAVLLCAVIIYKSGSDSNTTTSSVSQEVAKNNPVQHEKEITPSDDQRSVSSNPPVLLSKIASKKTKSDVAPIRDNSITRKDQDLTIPKNETPSLEITEPVKDEELPGTVLAATYPKNKTLQDFPVWDDATPIRSYSNPVILAGGGVNYGVQNIGYAVKLGIEKPVTSRLSVHTALAVNTNDRNVMRREIEKITPNVEVTNVITANSDGSYSNTNVYTVTSIDTAYKQINRTFTQTFAQALLGVDYALYKGGKVGVSADAFRLLRSKEQVNAFNNELSGDKPTTLWNVGMRIQYTQQLTKHFDIGTLYRQDISSMLNNNWENNFLQLMVIYKVGNKK